MKKGLLFFLFFLIFLTVFLPGQDDQKLEEYINVINVEINLRAYRGNRLVPNLTARDLQLFENGQQVPITSMTEVRRKIGTQQLEMEGGKPRLFILFFWIMNSAYDHQQPLDHFFTSVYRPGDIIYLGLMGKHFLITKEEDIPVFKQKFNAAANQLKNRIRQDEQTRIIEMEKICENIRRNFIELKKIKELFRRTILINEIISMRNSLVLLYKNAFQHYKFNYLRSNTKEMIKLAGELGGIKMEKWSFVFYQLPLFEIINPENEYIRASFIYGQDDMTEEMYMMDPEDITQNNITPLDSIIADQKLPDNLISLGKVRQAFFNANATFHLLLSKTTVKNDHPDKFFRTSYVASEWEETFRNITLATGGEIADGNRLDESFSRITEKEDIYYILTYSPKESSQEKRQLRIKSQIPGLKLYHHRRLNLNDITDIGLHDLRYRHPALTFKLKNYRMIYRNSQFQGNIDLKITATDPKGNISTITKPVQLVEEEAHLSLNLNLIHDTRYMLTVEATDKNTGKTSVASYKLKTPPLPKEIRQFQFSDEKSRMKQTDLQKVLEKSARYCEKLKTAAFHFFCQEKIEEERMEKQYTAPIHRDRTAMDFASGRRHVDYIRKKKRFYVYDYQIIIKDRKITENRTLIREKHKKVHKENAKLKTRFASQYSFFMPLIFSRENQDKYTYRLIKEQRLKGRNVYKVSVDPKAPEFGDITHGIAWVDKKDGSILKIQLHPRSFQGSDRLRKKALRRGYDLILTDEHWYLTKKNGIRFPSQTMISERYIRTVTSRKGEFENSRTYFTYSRYRFFDVSVDVKTRDFAISSAPAAKD